ncbi:MAG: TraM recognition domain-containing protein [Candidatus Pacebacteria bacterium]|nr:TraM recognition domain-containing protein [Candidatus Paceibacterota bacterium]
MTSKFDGFLSNDYMRPIVCQEKSTINIKEIMDTGKILLVNLSKGRLGDINSYLLGLILVGKFSMAALGRVDIKDPKDRRDFFLYLDEFQNVTTPAIASILSEARKYRLSLNIAHQYIKQIPEDIKDAVFGNVGSMAVFRVGPEDAKFLETQFVPDFTADDILKIDNYNCYMKLLSDNKPHPPFSLKTIQAPKGNPEQNQKLKELSALKYGRPIEEINEEINEKFKNIL